MTRGGRVLCVLALLVLALGLAQCGGGGEAPTATAPAEPTAGASEAATEVAAPSGQDFGVVRAGTEATYPPFESKDENGNIVGFDIDLLNAVAEQAGFEVEYVDTPFDGIFVALQAGDFDIVSSAATITAERAAIVDFSDPYFDAGLAVVVRRF